MALRRAVLRLLPAGPVLAALAVWAPPAGAAPVWTQVPSGTTDDISAVEYQADDRLWFTTTNGKVFRKEGAGFVQRLNAPGVVLNDIELRGSNGVAVGNGGALFRSGDAGANWTQVTLPVSNAPSCATDAPFGDLQKVAFASDLVVYAFGAQDQIARSADGGATWANANRASRDTCRIDAGGPVTGAFFVPGALTPTGYVQTTNFGELYFSNNDLQSGQKKDSGINGYEKAHRIVGDPANPNRQWGLASGEDGNSSYTSRTDTAWASTASWLIGNPDRRVRAGSYDLAFNGGTVLVAGASGQIMNSLDGRTFFYVDAGGPLVTQEWRAAALASAAKAAVGGVGGVLALSENANTSPDRTPPTGAIGGPSAVDVGQAATFTAQLADEAGGSGIDPTSIRWTVPGLPQQMGPTATFTFTQAGPQTLTLAFRDNEGNATEVSRSVVVNQPAPPPPATKTVSNTFAGGKISFSFPGRCVQPGASFSVRLAFKRSRRKGNVVVKVASTRFYAQGKSVLFDRRAPFAAVIRVKGAKPGTTYRLRARATLRVTRGRSPTRSIKASVKVC